MTKVECAKFCCASHQQKLSMMVMSLSLKRVLAFGKSIK